MPKVNERVGKTAHKTIKQKANEKMSTLRVPVESDKERVVAQEAYSLFKKWRDNRDKRFALLGDYTIVEYIDESMYLYNTTVYEREGLEEWQSRVNVPITRNKINNISGRAIQSMPIGQVVPMGIGKSRRATILNNLYEHSEDTAVYPLLMADMITDAMVKGTAICYEGHRKEVNLIRDVKSDGTVKVTKEIRNSLFSQLVPLEDFYPSTVFVNNAQELSGAAWREILDLADFQSKYGTFEKAAEVPGYSSLHIDQFPAYRDDANNTMGDGRVEVLHIYKRDTDEYIILANSFWINPIKIEGSGEVEVSPLPFKHKKVPFFSMKYEPLASNFLYGGSMPMKLGNSQEMLNVMTNMVFDQSVMSIFTPIITSSPDYIEDDFLRPGRRISIDTGGKSLNDSVKELNINPPTGWYQFILGYTKSIIEDASVDALSGGSTADLADRTTAKAVELAAAGIASSLSYFGLQIQEAAKQKVKLRVPNILQVYFDKKNPIAHKIIGEKVEYLNSAFNTFAIENAELSPEPGTGKIKRGRKIIEIYKDKNDLPTAEELKGKAAVEEAVSGGRVEIVAIPADYFRDMFEFDVKVVADKRSEQTQATEQAVAMFKAQTYMQLGEGIVDREEVLADLMESNGDDPTRLILNSEDQQQGAPGEMGGAPGGSSNNFGNNVTQQIAGATQRVNR